MSLHTSIGNVGSLFKALSDLNTSNGKWIFRGIENLGYDLIPSIFRNPDLIKSWLGIDSPYQEKIADQLKNELKILYKFFIEANLVGLPILSNWQFVLDKSLVDWEPDFMESTGNYSFKNLIEHMALAQHNGVPTRLLDFSFSSEIAIYFACKDIIDAIHHFPLEVPINEGAVWAINYGKLHDDRNCPIEFYVTPYSNNLHINKQKGLFVVNKYFKSTWEQSYPCLAGREGKMSDTDLNIVTAIKSKYPENVTEYLRCFHFPHSLKTDLIDSLDQKGINYASLMPSYSNVKDYLDKKMTYDKLSNAYKQAVSKKEDVRRGAIERALKSEQAGR